MPIYEYQCGACSHRFERIQGIDEAAPEQCPACGVLHRTARLISSSGFQLKGTGWYESDYKKPSAAPGSSEPSASGD